VYTNLSIVIPVYNEGQNILSTLSELKHWVRVPHEVLIVYDFDEDDTIPAIQKILSEPGHLRLIKNLYGRGVLKAIRTGFESARQDVILVVMADLSDHLSVVDGMFAKINEGYDLVCGSRYMRDGRQIGGPVFKKLLSMCAGLSLRYLLQFPVHDLTNSFKMYTRKVVRDVQIESTGGFEIGMEILIKAHLKGYRIAEVPSVWKEREVGRSNFKLLKWIPKYAYWYFFAVRNLLPARLRGVFK
jgi:dolichol-phosphate mannosyltransferase